MSIAAYNRGSRLVARQVDEHVAADGTRTPLAAITTPKSTEEVVREAVAEARVDKGADLRAAGWHCSPDAGWTNGLDGEYMSTDDAYAAMLAEREKAPPRDTDQEPVDAEMEAWAKSVLPGQPRWPVRAG